MGLLAAIGLLSEAYGLPLFFIIQECSAQTRVSANRRLIEKVDSRR
jgi:hypothetical protein